MIPGIIRLTEVTGADTIHICTAIITAIMMAIITEEVIPAHTITDLFITARARLLKTIVLPAPVAQEISADKMLALQVHQG